MDETMDYSYHHQEQVQGQAQLPYSQQQSRCPYLNRNEHHQQPPNAQQQQPQQQQQQQQRSTMHYDPVHASANYWHPQGQLPPYHWQPHVLGHRPQLAPQHRSSNSASEPHFYNHGPASSFGNALGGYPGAPNTEIGGPQTMHPSFSHSQLPPPVRYGHSTPLAPSQPTTSQPLFAPDRAFGQSTTSRTGAFNAPPHSLNTSTPSLTQDSSEPTAEPPRPSQTTTTESTGTASQAPPPSTSIQFGSAPPSSAPQQHSPFLLSPYRAHRSAPSGPSSTSTSSSTTTTTTTTPTSNFLPPNLRRAPGNPRRTMSRRQSPPSDGDMDSERDLRMVEQVIHASGSSGRLDGDHYNMDPVRAAQFLRGSVTTKYVASSSAIQSLQSVPISDLPEGERTCVICYNEYGVETPEGVKEAPLRLPKCKHVFGDHCIKKWLEDSDSCPYCRDKVPNEPRISSTNPNVNNMLRARGQVTLGGYAGFMRERDAGLSHDDSSRLSAAASGHGERRSPPTDGGESRRRIRPRHGTLRGPGSPPFSGGSRPGSFGASAASHENNRRSHAAAAANRAYMSNTNTPTRTSHGSAAQVSFPGGNPSQYQVPSFGSIEPSSATPSMPPYMQHGMHHGSSHGAHGTSFPNPLNRSSLPVPLPSAWVSGLPPTSDDSQRRVMPGEGGAQLQASNQWGQR